MNRCLPIALVLLSFGCDAPSVDRPSVTVHFNEDAGTFTPLPTPTGHRIRFGVEACVIDEKSVVFTDPEGEAYAPPWIGCVMEWSQSDTDDPQSAARFSFALLTPTGQGNLSLPGPRWLVVEANRQAGAEGTDYPVITTGPNWVPATEARVVYVDTDDATESLEVAADGSRGAFWAEAEGQLALVPETAELTRRVPVGDSFGRLTLWIDMGEASVVDLDGRRLQMSGTLRLEGKAPDPDDPEDLPIEQQYEQVYSCPGALNAGSITLPRIGCNSQFRAWINAQVCESFHTLPQSTAALNACCGDCVPEEY